jgi:hypothetical protein
MGGPQFWILTEDRDTAGEFDVYLSMDKTLGVTNDTELADARYALAVRRGGADTFNAPLPQDFLRPRLGLPPQDFAPDYFSFGGYYFCSRRFRDALAQSEEVVQYCAIELTGVGEEVRAQDYRWLRVLATQPAMDIERSECEARELTNILTGKTFISVRFIDRFAWHPGLVLRSEVVRIAESTTYILATDALAERVLRAGCTGVEFHHPDDPQSGERVERIRTIDGIREKRVHFLD